MILDKTLLLAGDTSRAKAYAQAMAHHGMVPGLAVVFGKASGDGSAPAPTCSETTPEGLFYPDLSVPLRETISSAGWRSVVSPTGDVNDPEIMEILTGEKPELVIYAGYGGQIVSGRILGTAPFLHMHSGRLPDERGSTTLYYSILRRGGCSVSALLLDEKIDTGPILMRKDYPLPPPSCDIDHLYDSAIRADLLIDTLAFYVEKGRLPEPLEQNRSEGKTYYIIHPVLKHIAILSVRNRPRRK